MKTQLQYLVCVNVLYQTTFNVIPMTFIFDLSACMLKYTE